MKRLRIFPLLLAAALMTTMLAGCGSAGDEPTDTASSSPSLSAEPEKSPGLDSTEDPAGSDSPDGAASPVMPVDSASALAAGLAPEDVVLSFEGVEVTWREMAYWLLTSLSYYEYYYGEFTDWDEVLYQDDYGEDVTIESYILWDATEMARLYAGVEIFAVENGVAVSEEDKAAMAEARVSDIEYYGSEEAYLEALASSGMDEALLNKMNDVSCLYNNSFASIYGVTGEKLPDEEVIYYAGLAGYMRAKHVLLTVEENTTDEEKQAMKDTLNGLLANLEAAEDTEALFNEYIAQYNEDPGMDSFPDGYTFGSGEMLSEFENAAYGLNNYGVSGIVETTYGYHIIMRLPLGGEYLTTSGASLVETLRTDASSYYFDQVIQSYVATVEMTETDKFGLIVTSEVLSGV